MPLLHLEVFETNSAAKNDTVVTDLNALEEARLASYEQGYTAGWEDAVSAQKEEQGQLSADLAHNLQALSFTYHEARIHVLKALEPLLLDIVAKVLPAIARDALGPAVLNALLPFAEGAADTPVKLLCNPNARGAIEPVLERANAPPIELVDEDTLGEGQVSLQLGDNELRVDLDGAIAEITAALADFLTISTKE